VVDNAWSMAEYGSQAVVWQTAVNPVVALELIEGGAWSGSGVLGPEALPPRPFLDLLTEYGSPWACEEWVPAGRLPAVPEGRLRQFFRLILTHRRPRWPSRFP